MEGTVPTMRRKLGYVCFPVLALTLLGWWFLWANRPAEHALFSLKESAFPSRSPMQLQSGEQLPGQPQSGVQPSARPFVEPSEHEVAGNAQQAGSDLQPSAPLSAWPTQTTAEPQESPAGVPALPAEKPLVRIPVLNYHSVADDPGNIAVTSPKKFAEQMDYLDKEGYTPLKLNDFFRIMSGEKEPPERPILLTFDDGYSDNYEKVMPILQKHRFPATLFMSPGTVGTDGYLSWEQVKEMHQNGWDIQPHGMTHPHLPKLDARRQEEEIAEAKKQIEAQLGTTADVFCYPYGEYDKITLQLLAKHGFRYAFTIRQGKTEPSQPPYELKRIFVNGEEPLSKWIQRIS
jgi:peptidoglycan/xylan/chitin deacetylase (PgdA/CDA1 family)